MINVKNKIGWSQKVTETSYALLLEKGVFTWSNPKNIAASLLQSALNSDHRKGTPLQSAMSMLNFYINRAGEKLPLKQREILFNAKQELRVLWALNEAKRQ
jgi:hypothetical protein